MGNLTNIFDPDKFEELQKAESTPTVFDLGEYSVRITEATVEPVNSERLVGNKAVFEVEFLDGKYQGWTSKAFSMLLDVRGNESWTNDNFAKWQKLCSAAGFDEYVGDTSVIVGKSVTLKINSNKLNAKGYADYKVSWLPAKAAGFVDTPF